LVVAVLFGVVVIVGLRFILSPPTAIENYVEIEAKPQINPDYSDIVIPANIAPLLHQDGPGAHSFREMAEPAQSQSGP